MIHNDSSEHPPTLEEKRLRDEEANRIAEEKARAETETKRAEAQEAHLEYLRRGGRTKRQKQASQRLRDVHTVAAGRWEVQVRDAWTMGFAEVAEEAAEVAAIAVRRWAAAAIASAEEAVKAADAEREEYLKGQSPEPFWRRVRR